jgi:hypothetical protein
MHRCHQRLVNAEVVVQHLWCNGRCKGAMMMLVAVLDSGNGVPLHLRHRTDSNKQHAIRQPGLAATLIRLLASAVHMRQAGELLQLVHEQRLCQASACHELTMGCQVVCNTVMQPIFDRSQARAQGASMPRAKV